MSEEKILYKELSYKIVGLAMQVHTELGFGFMEEVYQNALMVLFKESGINAVSRFPIKVRFHGHLVGDYIANILVDDRVILVLKAHENLLSFHRVQTLNYLKATGLKLAILLNFGKSRLEYERAVF